MYRIVRCQTGRKAISRRALLKSSIAGAALSILPRATRPAVGVAMPTAAFANRHFSVLFDGNRIGAHTILYSAVTGATRITTVIDIAVKALFFTVFAYSHRSQEIWRNGRLMALRSTTVEDGETLHISGVATPLGFRVISKDGPFIAHASTYTSNSLWTPTVLKQGTVVDAQHGGIIGVSARTVGDEQIVVAGRSVATRRYTFITPYLAGSIWYDKDDLWVHGDFERDGSKILYQLDG